MAQPQGVVLLKKLLLNLLKVAISAGILAYLVVAAVQQRDFADLGKCEKRWDLLAVAAFLCFLAVFVTMVRWYYLMRALNLPVTFRDALRIGFLGYLFNLSPVGIVGGDLLKCVMVARHCPGHRAESTATVFLDRLIGLYVLFLIAAIAIVVTGFWDSPDRRIQGTCRATLILALIGTLGMAILLTPRLTNGKLIAVLVKVPRFGRIAQRLAVAVHMYRQSPGVLLGSVLLTLIVHSANAAGIYLIATGLYGQAHSLGTHFVVTPLAFATGVLPLSLGPFEVVLGMLYAATPLPDGTVVGPGRGLVVSLGYRITTLLIAVIGVGYYLTSRQEVADVLHSAEGTELAE